MRIVPTKQGLCATPSRSPCTTPPRAARPWRSLPESRGILSAFRAVAVRSVTAAVWLVQVRSVWPRLAKAQELHNRHDHGGRHQCNGYGPRRVDWQRQPRHGVSKTAEHPRPTSMPLKRLYSGAPHGIDDVGGSILGMALPITAK